MTKTPLTIIDTHTGGEPTRTIVAGGPVLGNGSMAERRAIFQRDFDGVRRALVTEPRGSSVMVGALLCEPANPANAAGVIFFNNVGYLNMCGHGTIGLAVTLYHLGKITLGTHILETPVGEVKINLLSPNQVTIDNVPSYRFAKNVSVAVPEIGVVTGDIAWGGNWFFLIKDHGQPLDVKNSRALLDYCQRVQRALAANKIGGKDGALIDHIELFAEPADHQVADSLNFVLCPGGEYDRSPCGTGTSAKLACLYTDGELAVGQTWRQQSIIGSVFEGQVKLAGEQIIPQIGGQAYVNLEARVIFDPADPFANGI
jgi:4-hydroxyproline epimerase